MTRSSASSPSVTTKLRRSSPKRGKALRVVRDAPRIHLVDGLARHWIAARPAADGEFDPCRPSGRAAAKGQRDASGGSSQCPVRVLFLAEPPNPDAGEITDKGYINQRAVLARRQADVHALHAAPAHPRVILAD